jgi:hypothetical protein
MVPTFLTSTLDAREWSASPSGPWKSSPGTNLKVSCVDPIAGQDAVERGKNLALYRESKPGLPVFSKVHVDCIFYSE